MKARLFTTLLLLANLALASSWSVPNLPPEPPTPPPQGGQPHQPPMVVDARRGERRFIAGLEAPAGVGPLGETSTAVALGQPGFSHRYVATFGEPTVGYLEDASHIAWPDGVGVEGANVWIADSEGERAIQFTNGGSFVWQIGQAGYRHAVDGTTLEYIADVAVDSSGNIWLVDTWPHHVVKMDSGGEFVSELGVQWESGSDDSHFRNPVGVAFDAAGSIYVSDMSNHRIQVFDSSEAYIATLGVTDETGTDNDHFDHPRHITVDDGDLLYVADGSNHRVQIFDVSNPLAISYVATLGVTGVAGSDNGHFNYPSGVHVDAAKIYVADSDNHRIQIFDRATRAYQSTIGTGAEGSANNQFSYPSDVAVDSAGNIFVSDWGNTRVQQFNSSPSYVRTFGTTGVPYLTDGYHYNRPTGVVVGGDGSILLTEEKGHRLVKLDGAGAPQWTVGEPGLCGDDNAHFCGPQDVDLDTSGRSYVADTWNDRVQIFDSAGTYVATLGTGWGDGNYQFKYPNGVALDSANFIYVADSDNSRVQIYNSSRIYVATLGETGVPGSNNSHFDWPRDVDVDSAGNIYVLDYGNYRVQVFNSSRAYVRTIGVSGVPGTDFGHFENPIAVTVDPAGRTYVADQWGTHIKVYDSSGAFLTEFGGGYNLNGDFAQTEGMAVDAGGNVYLAQYWNQRLHKFTPGVPGWLQTNLNGFGTHDNDMVTSLASFAGQLYAGTSNLSGTGAQLWRRSMGGAWEQVVADGFGDAENVYVDHLLEFDGSLYAGTFNYDDGSDTTSGGQMWRSVTGNSGDWAQITLPGFDTSDSDIFHFAVFGGMLYASTWSYPVVDGMDVWRSDTGDSGDWEQVVDGGFGDSGNASTPGMAVFDGQLYLGTWNLATGAEVWRSDTGDSGDWEQVADGGFGEGADNGGVTGLAVFNNALYAGTTNCNAGGQVWRTTNGTGWTKVVDGGFGDLNNCNVEGLIVFDNLLYAVTSNWDTSGLEVWRTLNGTDWSQVSAEGLGDSNNAGAYLSNAITIFSNNLYLGTENWANGAEVWEFLSNQIYLPLVLRSP